MADFGYNDPYSFNPIVTTVNNNNTSNNTGNYNNSHNNTNNSNSSSYSNNTHNSTSNSSNNNSSNNSSNNSNNDEATIKFVEGKFRLGFFGFNSKQLFEKNPPKWKNHNKKIIYEMCKDMPHPIQEVSVTRWSEIVPLPRIITRGKCEIIVEDRGYQYNNSGIQNCVEWHVNFADKELFGFYGGPLYAQDESQVVEHPVLACVREALLKQHGSQCKPKTSDGSKATPVLVRGAQRRVRVATDPNPSEGRPNGLYGNEFMNASPDIIRRATQIINPPTISNIIAMEAPKFGQGKYTSSQINSIFITAYTSFMAAKVESYNEIQKTSPGQSPIVIIHTGHWGTGAYGGNKEIMCILQIAAAILAKVNKIVYWSFSHGSDARKAKDWIDKFFASNNNGVNDEISLTLLFNKIEEQGFVWGITNGT